MSFQSFHNRRQRLSPDFGEIQFSGIRRGERQLLRWRRELSIDARFVAPCIDAIPAVPLQIDGV